MKKIVMTAALVACAAVVTAQTVTSANIVGYNKIDRVNGLQIAGTSWEDALIGDVVGYDYTGGSRSSRATTLYTFDGAVYTVYYLYDDGAGTVEWRYVDGNTSAESEVFENGVSFLISDRDVVSGDVAIMSGEVNVTEYTTNSIAIGLALVTYPYSADVDSLDDLELTQSGTSGTRSSRADTIIVFDTASAQYITYYLHENAANFEARAWVPVGGSYGDPVPGISNGVGFFYSARNAFDWVELNPYFSSL